MKKTSLLSAIFMLVLSINIFAEGSLKVVAAYGGKEKIFQQFTKDTGIKVDFIDMSSGEVLSKLQAENGKPSADVWFGGGLDSFITAKNKGLLEKYISPEMAEVPLKYRDKDGYWSGVSLVLVGFMVNNEILADKKLDAPKTWADLTKPEYRDEVIMANPAISGTNYALVDNLIQELGEDKAWEYFEALNKNVPFLAKRGGEPPMKVTTGEFGVAVIPMSGEFILMEGKYPVTTIYPEDMIPWVPAGMAIFKNAENLPEAKKFVDWALSEKGQIAIRDEDPRAMVRNGVKTPESIKTIDMDKLINIDIDRLGNEREKVLNEWNKRFGNKAK
ncbi:MULTISPECIES: ABC transporter substrate-binding protein [Fusobacterium]|jgi:iron(III) transport system substrate-binding protein|nr:MULTISPECIES: ABC transporter substrate-binding protein [Fusobacterium]MDH6457959.1 iron(III) transport system substrate-binding protein [Fusobacterium sp. PH5-7]RGY66532.1 extracellular solute-binding protein [Fusobacterium ulcerans]HJH06096.1 ABC transporter substrate-binding protein [Fusobacterium ulcerans]